ncbi:MAG: DUF190 domain-containing protein [Phycisphaerae bacterium]
MLRGPMGFGTNGRRRAVRMLRSSEVPPTVIEIVDRRVKSAAPAHRPAGSRTQPGFRMHSHPPPSSTPGFGRASRGLRSVRASIPVPSGPVRPARADRPASSRTHQRRGCSRRAAPGWAAR